VQYQTSRSSKALVSATNEQSLPQVYLGRLPQEGGALPDETHHSLASRVKWIVSTCLVGVAGLCVIAVVMYASMDFKGQDGILSSMHQASVSALKPKQVGKIVENQPKITFGQKTDRIKLKAKGVTTSHIIHDNVVMRRDATEFIEIKPYVLIEASLATAVPERATRIPEFDPFELYAKKTPVADKASQNKTRDASSNNVALKWNDINLERLSIIDEHSISALRAEQFVAEAAAVLAETGAEFETAEEDPSKGTTALEEQETQKSLQEPNTTIVRKTPEPSERNVDQYVTTATKVRSGNTLYEMLAQAGARDREAKDIVAAMEEVPGAAQLEVGQQLRFTHLKTPANSRETAPIRVSLYQGKSHVVSVTQEPSGNYKATRDATEITKLSKSQPRRFMKRATLYSSIFHAALTQDLPNELVTQFLRTLAYDVDFKQRVGIGNKIRFFFDIEREPSGIEKPGKLLFAAMTVNGETYEYYRFRTPDGKVDFYNKGGSNSRKFLMRQPVKGARFTSGFGYRRHPILGTRRRHTGTDWAAPRGTPILAPGDGTVIFVGRKGGYGNHLRIKHGNGYKTTFSHLQKFAKNIRKGVRVQQGQVIGYIGSTGRSTGPHLHYEVLVNNEFTDPMKIAVGRSRQLEGRLLAEFKRRKERIDDLMRRAPVKTQVAAIKE